MQRRNFALDYFLRELRNEKRKAFACRPPPQRHLRADEAWAIDTGRRNRSGGTKGHKVIYGKDDR